MNINLLKAASLARKGAICAPPNADEWQYFMGGQVRMTVFGAQASARTFDFQAGDVGMVPKSMAHDVENTGDNPLQFLELFRDDRLMDVSPRNVTSRGRGRATPPARAQ